MNRDSWAGKARNSVLERRAPHCLPRILWVDLADLLARLLARFRAGGGR